MKISDLILRLIKIRLEIENDVDIAWSHTKTEGYNNLIKQVIRTDSGLCRGEITDILFQELNAGDCVELVLDDDK